MPTKVFCDGCRKDVTNKPREVRMVDAHRNEWAIGSPEQFVSVEECVLCESCRA